MDKLVKISLVTLGILIFILLLLFFLQPTNIVVVNGSKRFYMYLLGSIGIVVAIVPAIFLVKVDPEVCASKSAVIFHHIGVWGTRSCIVFIVFMLFAIGGYLLPKHVVNLAASNNYKEEVDFIEYRLAATETIPFQSGEFRFNNEFLVIKLADNKRLPLIINNIVGSNKLDYSHIIPLIRRRSLPGIYGSTRVLLLGRKHKLGRTYDALKLMQ